MIRQRFRWVGPTLLAAIASWPAAGCGPSGHPTTSPITSSDSEAGRKAIADDERFVKERRAQEAKASKRLKGLPTEG